MWSLIALGLAIFAVALFLLSLFIKRKSDEAQVVAVFAFVLACIIMIISWISTWDMRAESTKCADSGKVYVWNQCLSEDQLKMLPDVQK